MVFCCCLCAWTKCCAIVAFRKKVSRSAMGAVACSVLLVHDASSEAVRNEGTRSIGQATAGRAKCMHAQSWEKHAAEQSMQS